MRVGSLKEVWTSRRWRLAVAWTAGSAVVGVLGFLGYMEMVKAGWIKYNKWDRREKGALQVGQPAPDLELPLVDEGTVRLSELWRERPVVLVFGSCT
jgi:hypothetical protein